MCQLDGSDQYMAHHAERDIVRGRLVDGLGCLLFFLVAFAIALGVAWFFYPALPMNSPPS
jgi:hypothetical protein